MIASEQTVRPFASGLDHPETVCADVNGTLYAGGEAGQVYRIDRDGKVEQYASTGGKLAGMAVDGEGRLYVCDGKLQRVLVVDPDGSVKDWSTGTADRPMEGPNSCAFDRDGNLYVSDSGEFFDDQGTGCLYVVDTRGETRLFHSGPLPFPNGVAVDPASRWLYVIQTTRANAVRFPLDRPDAAPEVTHQLPPGVVPDGLLFTANGWVIITCYKPDAIYIGDPDGGVEMLVDDPTGQLLSRPTNGVIVEKTLYVANLGDQFISAVDLDLKPGTVWRPRIPST